ncbi:MAG: right-handed parallel beta-helix repeat-containing protein [Armatimonadota bacterium]
MISSLVFALAQTIPTSPGDYIKSSDVALRSPAYSVSGNNITLDFKGVVLRGTPKTVDPDQRKGIGVRITGSNITIKNLTVAGYKVGILAENCKNLNLINCDVSWNWKQRLLSTPEKEDLNDWMSFHSNEKREWFRYGAGVYLDGVTGFEVKGLKAYGGQCGLMMNRSEKGVVWNSNINYMSAIGIGMYRSSNNRIMHNNLDYCVRGYSHGVYNRGQDSAAILVFEQSNKNVFAFNSARFGGDGFFLWAGQTTMDTGKGGCNENLLYGNDFSDAPTNGIEATFSRNKFVNNRVDNCWHGFWTGYSYDTLIAGNHISGNVDGIAHEHGQNITVESNQFLGNNNALRIWANEKQDPNWGYPKARNTRSIGWQIKDNAIGDLRLSVTRSENVLFEGNNSFNTLFAIDPSCKDVRFAKNCLHTDLPNGGLPERFSLVGNECEKPLASRTVGKWDPRDDEDVWEELSPEPLKGGMMPFTVGGSKADLRIDQWGPVDYRAPVIVPTKVVENGWQKLSVLGPKGTFKVKVCDGFEIKNSIGGQVPGSIWIRPDAEKSDPQRQLKIVYTGGKTVDHRGIVAPAGTPITLTHETFEVKEEWSVHFFPWGPGSDPRTEARAYDEASVLRPGWDATPAKLDYTGYGGFEKGVPKTHFGTIATGKFTVPEGTYALEVTGDDGIVCTVDEDIVVCDEWHYQGPTTYSKTIKLSAGTHKVTIHHFQIDGYAALKFRIKPAR